MLLRHKFTKLILSDKNVLLNIIHVPIENVIPIRIYYDPNLKSIFENAISPKITLSGIVYYHCTLYQYTFNHS